MRISFSPQRRETGLSVSRSGDVLTIDGKAYDFGPIPDGGLLPRAAIECKWLASDVERINGVLHLTLILPHGPSAPEQTRFPEPLTVTDDGPITLPPYALEASE